MFTTMRGRPLAALCGLELAVVVALRFRLAAGERNLGSGLILLAAAGLGLLLVGDFVAGMLGCGAEARARIRLLVVTVAVMLPTVELYLRFGPGLFATYLEKNGSANYVSLFEYDRSTWFRTHPPNFEVVYERPEFTHVRKTNSLGLAEREIPVQKQPDELRVVALGDSYTEGMGADYEGTWVKVAERRLAAAAPRRRVTTINAGISGSDVAFEFVLLRERLYAYKPDLVIVAINSSDATDLSVRGGRQRFSPDGSLRPGRRPPGWEWLYSISYISRAVVHVPLGYDWRFIQRSRRGEFEQQVVTEIRDVVDDFAQLARERGFKLLIVVSPTRWEASRSTWTDGFDRLLSGLQRTPGLAVLDMMERLVALAAAQGHDPGDFYWPIDGHFNAKGYEAVGTAVAEAALGLGLEPAGAGGTGSQ